MMLYRSRLVNDINKITLDYVSSISDDFEIAWYDIVGSQAHAIMLYENNILKKTELQKILSTLENLKKENFEKKSDSEDIHELIESNVIKTTGMDVGGKLHTARSRNDQVSLDIRMKIRDDINILCSCLLDVIETLASLAKQHQKTIFPLYTHLQQAQVGLFSHYLLSYVDALFRDLDRLYMVYGRVNESPLGAGAIGGTSIPIDRHSTAKMLGFKGLVENSIDATSTRDFVAEYVATVSILMTNLSKISEDFVIWSTSEFSFIELADEFTSPSSVMPQKKNPDILELTRGKTSQIIGNLMFILSTMKGLATGYGRDLQQINSAIWSTSKISISALIVLKSLLITLTVNEKKMKKAAESGYLTALDIAEKLVLKDVPFRVSHKIVGQLVQIAYQSNKTLSKLSENEIKKSIKNSNVSSKMIFDIIKTTSIKSSLHDRVSEGSSGVSEQKRMIKDRTRKINAYRVGITRRENLVSCTYDELSKKIKDIIK